MKPNDIEEILNRLGTEDVPADAKQIAREMSKDFGETLMKPKRYILSEYIMKSRITKLAAAAAIIIAVLIGIHEIGGSSITLAGVLEKVEQTRAFMYRMNATMTNNKVQTEVEGTFIISNQYGVKMESVVHMTDPNLLVHQQIYIIPNEKTMMVISPDSKMYQLMEIRDNTGEAFERMKGLSDLRDIIKELMTQQYTDLGCSEIDGITVQGFLNHISDEAGESTTTFWVDVDTWLPVKYELNATHGEEESHIVMDQFRWDISVDANVFEYVIPDDYKEMGKAGTATAIDPNSIKMLEMNDQAAIKGLEAYKEFFSQYPEKIDLMSLMKSLTNVGDPNTELGKKLLEKIKRKMETVGLDQVKLQEFVMQDFVVPLQSLGTFYMTLVQDKKDPAYYGAQVTPEDTDAVLMRWKADSGKYKVIFGDLTVEDVTAAELAELEAAPLNSKPTAIRPKPEDGGSVAFFAEVELSWTPGAYVNQHKVYFGTATDQMTLLAEVTDSCSVTAPALEKAVIYYWRVDEAQPDGSIAAGDIWSFDTGKLVGFWEFDGNADDSSGSENHGTIIGEPNLVTGKIGGALQFDGIDDSVSTDYATDLPTWTVALWVKSPAAPSDAAPSGPLHREANFQINWDHIYANFRGAAGLRAGNKWYAASFGELQANTWYHLAATYDGENLKAYKNGVLITDNPDPSGSPYKESATMKFGRHSTNMHYFEGVIDDVYLYSYDLSADEVAANYAGGNQEK